MKVGEPKIKNVSDSGLSAADAQDWYCKYRSHVMSCKDRGISTNLSFIDYLDKAKEAGITSPKQIGRHHGDYQLGRVGDVGGYDETSRFITREQNDHERVTNGGQARGALKAAEKLRGRTMVSHGYIATTAAKIRGRTKETHDYLARMAEKKTGRTVENDSSVAATTEKISKSFRLIDPDGNVHEGKNLAELCRKHNLNIGTMAAVARGQQGFIAHKGWTGSYLDVSSKGDVAI